MRVPIFHVDAFTDRPLSGNPAAVCFLDSWLDDGWLRKVAAENNLSATAFLVREGDYYNIRWFTRSSEIRLCGHATFASAFVVLHYLEPAQTSIRFNTRHAGMITVQNAGDSLSMSLPAFIPTRCDTVPQALLLAVGRSSAPVEVLEANNTYFVVFDDPETVRTLQPDFQLIETLHPYAVSVSAKDSIVDFVSRYFAPSYGLPEDPVTGSAHCGLTPYWRERLGKDRLHAMQLSERGGRMWCEMAGDRVKLTGKAVLTLRGTLSL